MREGDESRKFELDGTIREGECTKGKVERTVKGDEQRRERREKDSKKGEVGK